MEQTKKRYKAGIMGGTFDPIHIGHLVLGERAHHQFGLDKVFYMPAGNPPHKQNRKGRATDEQRVEMVKRAIASNPHFALSLVEMNADGYSYTYRTLERLRAQYPDTDFYFIMGADSLADFHEWKEPQRIADAANIVVATRNQMDPVRFEELLKQQSERFHTEFLRLDTPNLDISSKNIRAMVRNGISPRYYIQDVILDYITENGIYLGEEE